MSAVGDARKRLHPSPLTHHDPAVRDLIQAAAAAAWDEGFQAACDQTSVFHTPDGPTDDQNPHRRLS